MKSFEGKGMINRIETNPGIVTGSFQISITTKEATEALYQAVICGRFIRVRFDIEDERER